MREIPAHLGGDYEWSGLCSDVVPVVGLEPTPCRQERILSPSRLPFHHTGDSTPNIILDAEEEFKRKYRRKTEK